MCRYFIMLKQLSQFSKWAYLSTIGYTKHCKDNLLSTGLVEVNKKGTMTIRKNIPPLMCINEKELLNKDTKMVIYHVRIPFSRTSESVSLENVHPFIFDNRFICIHNCLIYFKTGYAKYILPDYFDQINGTTDSEQFFALWLSLYSKNKDIEKAFREACEYVTDDSTMNLVLYDKHLNQLYIYRSKKMLTKLVPPVYVTENGFANFKLPNSKTIPKDKLILISPTIS